MSRTKNTQFLAIASGVNLFISSVFSIIIGRIILVYLGSEYNGINAIVSQFLMIISIIEGGLTTASIVAMMRPYEKGDMNEVNQIFAETSFKFKKICILYIFIGFLGAIAYSFAIKTNIQTLIIILVLLIGVTSSCFNIGIISKYRLVFQVAQKEHIFTIITLCFNIIGQISMVLVLIFVKDIVVMRFTGMIFTILGGVISVIIFSKIFNIKKIKWDKKIRIKGTKDVFIGKVVGTIHSSSTTLFLSIFSSAALTSVYSVYNSVVHVIYSIVNIGFSSPQNAIGQVLQGEDNLNKEKVIMDYQYIIIVALTVLFIPLCVLIVPFVKIYTHGVTDIDYVNYELALLLIISTYFQLLHIPSGICIYMSGSFKVAKKIQIIALIILLLSNCVFGFLIGWYGFLVSIMICNIFLALCEIIYVHTKIISKSITKFIKMLIINIIIMVILVLFFNEFANYINSIISWIIAASIITIMSIILTLFINRIFLKKEFKNIKNRFLIILKKIR